MNPEMSKTVIAIIGAVAAVLAGNAGMNYHNGNVIGVVADQNYEILKKLETIVDEKVLPAISLNAENKELNQEIELLLQKNTEQNAEILVLIQALRNDRKFQKH